MSKTIEEAAKELRNEYYRDWRSKNPDKFKKHINDYWMRKAEKKLKEEGEIK